MCTKATSTRTLTPRQQREREFYDQYVGIKPKRGVSFEPIENPNSRPWNSYWYHLKQVVESYSPDRRTLLEFGCGQGVNAVRYAAVGFRVYGFDISPGNIAHATALAEEYGVSSRTHFSVQAAESLDYESGFFDIVAGTDILHHCVVEGAIRECHRVLKEGGKAFFREHVEPPLIEKIRKSRPVMWLFDREASFEKHITEDERLLNAHDLEIIRSRFERFEMRRFGLFARLRRLTRRVNFQRLDHLVFRCLPFMRTFGVDAVISLQSPKRGRRFGIGAKPGDCARMGNLR